MVKACYDWLSQPHIEVRSMVKPNFLHGKLYRLRQPDTTFRSYLVGRSAVPLQ